MSRWENALSLPNARYIANLERLMGAPWSYLDDPGTEWPRELDREALTDLLGMFSEVAIDRLIELLEAEVQKNEGASGK